MTSVGVGMGRWPGRGLGREWSEGKRVTDGILGLIWDFASSGPRFGSSLWRRSASSGTSRFGPGADQGRIKVAACVSHAIPDRTLGKADMS
jgi:hypothetical protein